MDLYTKFFKACISGNVKLVSKLLLMRNIHGEFIIKTSAKHQRAIRLACEYGKVKIIKILLEQNETDPCTSNNMPITNACENGHLNIIKLLLTYKKVFDNTNFDHLLELATIKGHINIARYLLEFDNRLYYHNYAFVLACQYGHIEII
jgi:ankyrin repeat protein